MATGKGILGSCSSDRCGVEFYWEGKGMKGDLRCMWSGTRRHRLDVLGLQVDPSRSFVRSASGSSEEMWWKQQPVDCTHAQ